jgi:hypothetical protein
MSGEGGTGEVIVEMGLEIAVGVHSLDREGRRGNSIGKDRNGFQKAECLKKLRLQI